MPLQAVERHSLPEVHAEPAGSRGVVEEQVPALQAPLAQSELTRQGAPPAPAAHVPALPQLPERHSLASVQLAPAPTGAHFEPTQLPVVHSTPEVQAPPTGVVPVVLLGGVVVVSEGFV